MKTHSSPHTSYVRKSSSKKFCLWDAENSSYPKMRAWEMTKFRACVNENVRNFSTCVKLTMKNYKSMWHFILFSSMSSKLCCAQNVIIIELEKWELKELWCVTQPASAVICSPSRHAAYINVSSSLSIAVLLEVSKRRINDSGGYFLGEWENQRASKDYTKNNYNFLKTKPWWLTENWVLLKLEIE